MHWSAYNPNKKEVPWPLCKYSALNFVKCERYGDTETGMCFKHRMIIAGREAELDPRDW